MGISLSYYADGEYWRLITDGISHKRTSCLEEFIPVTFKPKSYLELRYYMTTKNTIISMVGECFSLKNTSIIETLDILHDIDTTGINVFRSSGKLFYASKTMLQEELENVKYYKWGYQRTSNGGTITSKYGAFLHLISQLDIEPEFEMDAFIMTDEGTTLYYGDEKVHTNIRTLTGLINKYSKK